VKLLFRFIPSGVIKVKLAIYPGTFDPVTNGHLDIIQRAVSLFDHLIVAVTNNPSKNPLFSVTERVEMIRTVTSDFGPITVDHFDELLVDYATKKNAVAIVRGLRATIDFEYELQMALVNRKLAPDIATVFLMTHDRYTYLSSTVVKELARLSGAISCFVPPSVEAKLREKYQKK
jgi:pantetheine-phosphate adenylyltransferase